MKIRSYIAIIAFVLSSQPLFAQWITETYTLKGGWNAIYLHGDATHATPAQLFKNTAVSQVWRWNPNPNQIQFTQSPSIPSESSSEWTIWKRDDPEEQKLSALVGQSSYLVFCDGLSTNTITLQIPQRPRPPAATWLISGANFLGFPAATATRPILSSYFASFPKAIASPAKVYKYIGGDLNANNPMQVSTSNERLDRNTAYWFEAAVVSDFTAPVEYEVPGTNGLAFGRTATFITMGVMNRTSSALTLTLATETSEPAPVGQTGITGPVPLTYRTFNSSLNTYVETPVSGSFSVTIPANGRMDLQFGVDRSKMSSSSEALYASFLQITDSAGLSRVRMPLSAQAASAAGLWVGEVSVENVASTVPGSPGSTTSRPFPLRMLVHVDANNTARLLSQVFLGPLNSGLTGIATRESLLHPDRKAEAMRLVSSQMPLDRVITGSGSFAVGSSLTHQIVIPFNDAVNPFVHQYHPDHDNRDANLRDLQAGVESYDITRTCTFTFTQSPPDGSSIAGWGTSTYGGTYAETIRGLNKSPVTLRTSGTFTFRRLSEIAELVTN
jgi:hypothetical protein